MKDSIIDEIKGFAATSPYNLLKTGGGRYFDEPLVGFAHVHDPLFAHYKEIIGEFHLTPLEFFQAEFGAEALPGGTVISWILPISDVVRRNNRKENCLPSMEWAHTRFHGEGFNDQLKKHIVGFLVDKGYRTLSPSLHPLWKRIRDEKVGFASRWSERHVAYAAGLGTFSLTDALITARGIAHRCGSIVTELAIEPTERQYKGVYDYCLAFSPEKCGGCIKRCPAGAITEKGHNKDLCHAYMEERVKPAVNERYEVAISGCGLCQTKVPCEKAIPVKNIIDH